MSWRADQAGGTLVAVGRIVAELSAKAGQEERKEGRLEKEGHQDGGQGRQQEQQLEE